jgi:hypothetical protein
MLGTKATVLAATLTLSCCALGWCLAAAGTARAQGSSQPASSDGSIADAARKARENKKNAPTGKKVYTDDDVRPATPEAPAAANGTPAPGTAETADVGAAGTKKPVADGEKEAASPNDEKAWRKRFQAQREQIARAEKELDVLQREEEKDQVQYYPDPQKALAEGYTRKDINEKDTKIAAKRQELAQLKQGLDDLEDQLRKSGGDSSWAR